MSLIAISKKSLKTRADLQAAKKEIALKDSLIKTYDQVEKRYEKVYLKQKEYIGDLEDQLEGYKKLAKGYKKLSGETLLSFDGGIGATGSGKKPVVMAGIGISKLRIWGLLQEQNSGILLGLNFPVF